MELFPTVFAIVNIAIGIFLMCPERTNMCRKPRKKRPVPAVLLVGFVVAAAPAGAGEDESSAGQTAPYAAWENGPGTDAGFFPIAVWLQAPKNAPKYRAIGINLYVGLWKGPTQQQLAELKQQPQGETHAARGRGRGLDVDRPRLAGADLLLPPVPADVHRGGPASLQDRPINCSASVHLRALCGLFLVVEPQRAPRYTERSGIGVGHVSNVPGMMESCPTHPPQLSSPGDFLDVPARGPIQ